MFGFPSFGPLYSYLGGGEELCGYCFIVRVTVTVRCGPGLPGREGPGLPGRDPGGLDGFGFGA
jgi:hypothetical protein